MKNNILHKFAIKDLKTHSKDTIISLITISCVALFMFLTIFLSPMILNSQYLEFRHQYGTYNYSSSAYASKDEILNTEITLDDQKQLIKDANLSYAMVHSIGMSLTNDSIDYIEGKPEIIAVNIMQGKMPIKANEIAIKESVLKKLGYEIKIHQTVKIPYKMTEHGDQTTYDVKEWNIVGILENTGMTDILVGKTLIQDDYIIYLKVNGRIQIEQYDSLSLSDIDGGILGRRELDYLTVIIEFMLFIIGGLIVSGLTVASFENRKKDYALMRGLGATKRQMYYVVLMQALFIASLSLGIASLLYLGIGNLLKFGFRNTFSLQFYLEYYLGIVFIIIFLTFISYFMPARGACRHALTGTFESSEFQYFYYRYKKLHKMRPFYLGWRQIVGRKKQMLIKIFLIFIVSLLTLEMVGNQIDMKYIDYQNKKVLEKGTEEGITLEYYRDFYEKNFNAHDFDVFKKYAQKVLCFLYIDGSDLDKNLDNLNLDGIYGYNADLREEFHLQNDLKPGQIITSHSFSNNSTNLYLFDSKYAVVDVIPYEKPIVIMCKEDFDRYADSDNDQKIKIYFDNVHDKTNGLIAFAKQSQLKNGYNWQDSLVELQRAFDYQQEDYTYQIPILEPVLILGASIIYIYQLAYEILKDRENIGTYQLLGFQKFEIWKIYAFKSFLIAMIGLICGLYYHFVSRYMVNDGQGVWYDYIQPLALAKQIGLVLFIIVILISLSLLPIYTILKREGLENKNIRE